MSDGSAQTSQDETQPNIEREEVFRYYGHMPSGASEV